MNAANVHNREQDNYKDGKYYEPIQIIGGGTWKNDDFVNESALPTGRYNSLVAAALKKKNTFSWDEKKASENNK